MNEPTPSPRIGDAERDEAVQCLQAHMSEGRLTAAEFDERMSSALEARTLQDLTPLFEDLPDPHPVRVPYSGSSLMPSPLGSPTASRGEVAKPAGKWDLSPQAVLATVMSVAWGLAVIGFLLGIVGWWAFLIPALLLPSLGNLIRKADKKEIGPPKDKPEA